MFLEFCESARLNWNFFALCKKTHELNLTRYILWGLKPNSTFTWDQYRKKWYIILTCGVNQRCIKTLKNHQLCQKYWLKWRTILLNAYMYAWGNRRNNWTFFPQNLYFYYKAIAQCAKIGKIDFNFLFACVNSNAKISLSQIFHHSILGFPKLHFFRILCHCE